jgi:arabinogalactan endo-1,4-beta-galactosidase
MKSRRFLLGLSACVLVLSMTVCFAAKVKVNNLVFNSGLEKDPSGKNYKITGWTIISDNDTNAAFTESGWTHSGQNKITNWKDTDFKVYTYQTVENVPAGVYNFEFWYANGDGANDCYVELKDFGGDVVKIPITKSASWIKKAVADIKITAGKCTIGIYSDGKAGYWINMDDFTLYNQKDLDQPE